MAKKDDTKKFYMTITAIVAIVAVVGIITLFTGRQAPSVGVAEDIAGEAFWGSTKLPTITLPGPTPTAACQDTDGGKDAYVLGKIIYTGRLWNQDRCYSTSSVMEYYCKNDKPTSEIINCPSGCQNGVCLAIPPPPACIETDGGLNENISGTCDDNNPYIDLDSCWGDHVYEYFCMPNDTCKATYIYCGAGRSCQNGACS